MLEKVISILFPVFAVVAAGFFVGKAFRPDMRHINRINIDLMVPCLIFTTLSVMPLGSDQTSMFIAAIVAVLLPGVLMVPISGLLKLPFKTWGPPQMFRNSGNLAIPLFGYAFGASAEAPAILLFVVSMMLHITVGLALLSNSEYRFQHILKMPILVAAMLAMVFNFADIQVWTPLNEAMILVGNAAVPVMLISLGVQLTGIQWSGFGVGVLSTVLSLVTGAITFAVIYFFIPLPSEHLRMLLLFAMLPPAVMNYLFAERFNVGPDKVASMVLFGNFFTLITLPLLLIAAFAFF
ncbi:AEC family transporter [Enterovibrio paralichthyis]|uniref:AEC family transporter n=1 Tax=Enterovibrio paralichthyis TaxID=2853805 RepID=UPI0006D14163|nr:AEC family transporter [Enterovibrio paralichthyis]MBV7296671.1 AEC family transporter [Enterovibrio paralichthyis]